MIAGGLTQAQGWGITVLRVVVGSVFLLHGGQKLFVWGIGNVAGSFGQMGIPLPMLAAIAVTLVEFLGGLALLVGLCTRWAAIPLAVNMIGAMVTVHLKAGFFLPDGYEFVLTLLAANVTLALLGSGEASLERVFRQRRV
ncbi:MAG TPA: DoxX family protein [Candidatus Methylomirabilis sp.]|nr:DoxX family protein [Candidatus Methylomirabilis sp.]